MVARRKTMSFVAMPKTEAVVPSELDPTLRIFIAPELRGRKHGTAAVRNPDDSDADYERSLELFALFDEIAQES